MLAVVSRLAAAGCWCGARSTRSAHWFRRAACARRGVGQAVPEAAHVDDFVRRQRSELDRRGRARSGRRSAPGGFRRKRPDRSAAAAAAALAAFGHGRLGRAEASWTRAAGLRGSGLSGSALLVSSLLVSALAVTSAKRRRSRGPIASSSTSSASLSRPNSDARKLRFCGSATVRWVCRARGRPAPAHSRAGVRRSDGR